MKKLLAMLLVAILALSATAFAATYNHEDDISFEYDENAFELSMDDHIETEDLVILSGKDAAWGATFIRIHLQDMDDDVALPTLESIKAMPDTTDISQGEWNGFKDVIMYNVTYEDGASENYFIAPVVDEDGEVEDLLTVIIGVTKMDDEDAAMNRDDLISAVVDSLKVDD